MNFEINNLENINIVIWKVCLLFSSQQNFFMKKVLILTDLLFLTYS